MPPTNACPRCGHLSPPSVTFCASCGSRLSSPPSSGAKGWKLLLGAVALFAGLLWASALYTQQSAPARLTGAAQPRALVGTDSGAAQAAQPAQAAPPLTLTAAQHLSEARRALADGYKPHKDARKAQWGEVAAARWHLKAIPTGAPEYREAQELLKEVARRERRLELAGKEAERDEDSDVTAEAGAADADPDAAPSVATSSPASGPSPSSPAPTRTAPPASTSGGGSSSDYYTNSRGVRVRRPTFSENGPPPGATAQCRDGSYSFSQNRRGTCSHHGGVSRWL